MSDMSPTQTPLTQDQIVAKWQEAMDKWQDCLIKIEQMHDALGNVLGLCDLLSHRDDIPAEVKEFLTSGWRRREAQSVWGRSVVSSAHPNDGRVRLVDQNGTELTGAGPACAACGQIPRPDCPHRYCAFARPGRCGGQS